MRKAKLLSGGVDLALLQALKVVPGESHVAKPNAEGAVKLAPNSPLHKGEFKRNVSRNVGRYSSKTLSI
jgi:hypothetical protein